MDIDVQQVKQRLGIIGNAPKLLQAIRTAVQVAPTDATVLITGESGVGKEFFPKIVHQYSIRKHKNYIAINCGAIPEGTIDSELFGHRKGSFTGALSDRKGYFEEANEGTIFLDEVGELPLATQARLLRVLENGEFIPVGASQPIKTNVRIVAATNVNMAEAIRNGRFREDLYYRLNTVPILVPPLRERGDDIALLFRRFASDYASMYQVPPLELSADAKHILITYRWPGNIRELRNITERMSILEQNRLVEPEVLRNYLSEEGLQDLHPVVSGVQQSVDQQTFANEREILYQVLFDLRRDFNELKQTVNEMKGAPLAETNRTIQMVEHTEACSPRHEDTSHTLLPKYTAHSQEHAIDYDEVVEPEEAEESISPSESPIKGIITIEEAERQLITQALGLQKASYTRQQIADMLGISARTLSRKIKEYGLE
ncbi:sigma-54 dependent transcriptional regulator [uncultured Porphyromonas sp.]|uniref:sigma-54 interaction domain-containing protein n=1 Tax=uncultured Porphyromonas sp. TaxID=159274 RepID=UPI0026086694|nr:sigma-54 dependent transcriptional regulator [uncultured Porphyromonas sp.]